MKKNVVVLFGGNSSEHDVSCISAQTVIKNIDIDTYNVLLVGITRAGSWLYVDSVDAIADGSWRESKASAAISPDTEKKELIIFKDEGYETKSIDVVFPVLHGLNGEDGTVQGLLELAKIPYVGCGVLASAVSMDKVYTKIIVDKLGIRQASFVDIRLEMLADMDKAVMEVEDQLDYPVFVKPSCAGSSQGVSKAHNREELIDALNLAAQHDRKILVEETIIGREIECAVLGAKEVKASGVGEILAAAEFYDFDAKYNNAESKTVVDPDLSSKTVEKIRDAAVRIFKAVDGFGLARVDFFVAQKNGRDEVIFNEINTLPGFTAISMYPMLWNARGIETKALVNQLIEMAYERF
ncbi:MAG: D-alanine--D-alanine ligase family protein [Lachnospiraceae bacterium]|nr:D-alanine--D-alanine ligase family protein [Lachnospiraceae bacterium]